MLLALAVLIFVAYKKWTKKEERDQEELREEGERAQREDLKQLDEQKQNRNTMWTGLASPAPAPAQPPPKALSPSALQMEWQR